MQRGPPRRTTGDVNARTGGEEDACHRSGRGVIERGVPFWLLGIGIAPKANERRRQLGLAGQRGVVEQCLAAPAPKPCAGSIAFDRGKKSVARRCPQGGAEGCIRSE